MTIKKVFRFYFEGFKNMPKYGRYLWLIILVKAFLMFAVLKLFFFKSHLSQFETEKEKSEYVSDQLTKRASGEE
ncbi:MAG: DUF4492 domain-containing protein [Bacteroidia bacterium]|nr:MAG: DUF4492 domain-containing protein [Bacteroidia bacterium]